MQHTGDPSVQAEAQLRGVPSVGHRFCPAKSTQLGSLGSSQNPLAVNLDALLGGSGRLVPRTQLSAYNDWMTVSSVMESRLKPFSDASTSREQIDALVWFVFAGVDDVSFRVNRLEYPASIDTLHQSHVCSQG
jgi:hypothetical protein